ncbi:ATP-dependent nuclease [Phytoactinopolyspora halotolerans]|uniref:AAA family ATPase n=1 Tax=Phytoactinopolyspora halotolerans TaxID=1981512 RepID=A0A6L9SA45_9ACTN|nr:AAA family ATPase [Phytoactinopolyspora halotolerans]NEE01504.1 AAA family ATPase [Phytoactinopolyspora halotolerans]
MAVCASETEVGMAPRIESLSVRNLRSVGDERVTVRFPESGVLVLLGENNAGKSNVTRALDILFGDTWPGSRRLEDHDFHERDSDGIAVEVGAAVSGIPCTYCNGGEVAYLSWSYDPQNPSEGGSPVTYRFTCSNQRCNRSYVKNEMRSALSAAVLDADRRLDYQLSYASKYTMLSKLMHRFHERLLADPVRKQQLAQVFSSLLAEFGGVPEFAEFKRLLAETAADLGQNLPYRLDIDFSAYDPSNFFRSLRIHPTLSGDVRNFDELGTGQSQVLALAFAYAYAMAYGQSDGTILVVDEPEANLHPLAQQWLATRLNGLAEPGLQVVLTTHSPHFVDLVHPENLVMVRKQENGATTVMQRTREELRQLLLGRGAHPERTHAETIGPFYAAGATTEIISGLFARRCVLVEGPTEALALPELLRARGLDVLQEGIAVVSVEGISNIAKWHRLFTTLGIECFCVFDTDSNKTGTNARDLLANRQDIMAALGHDADKAKAENLSTHPISVEDGYATLNPNFEGALAALFGDRWSELYVDAAPLVGDSKSLRARYAAQHLGGGDFTGDAAATLDALIQAIRGKPAEQADANEAKEPAPEPSAPDQSSPDSVETSAPTTADEPPF